MSRTHSPSLKPDTMAWELAALTAELEGPRELAALAIFGRFLFPERDLLEARVAALPDAARQRWLAVLGLLDAPTNVAVAKVDQLAHTIERDKFWGGIDREAAPVLPEGRLFELFLHALDRQQGRRRGVYYTPQPLVSFLLRGVRQSLANQFDDAAQLNLIDPACGYGAFLLAAARQLPAHQTTGWEICPITWAVAHLLLASASHSELRLFQDNPLEAGESLRESLLGPISAPRMPVIIGNPPWSNFGRQNRSPWITRLLTDYRTGLAERKSNLADDSIKFLRWGQYWIDQAGCGILAFVTPSTWLDGLTHRRMRQSLLGTFDDVSIVDLHGNVDEDENVFGVRSGVALIILVKRPRNTPGQSAPFSVLSTQHSIPAPIHRLDLVGTRADKLARLRHLDATTSTPLEPHPPDWSLALPRATHAADYASFWPLDRIFPRYISGVQTKNDAVFVGFTREKLSEQVQTWLTTRDRPLEFDPAWIRPYLVAPFDRRWIYYDPRLIGRARYKVLQHMLRPNVGLVFMRQSTGSGEYDHFLAVDVLVSDRVFYSRRGAPFIAPLWVGEDEGVHHSETNSNLNPSFVSALAAVASAPVRPRDAFHYLYAVCHAPSYRRGYSVQLRRDFPRLPLTKNAECFWQFSELGRKLVDLHLWKINPAAPEPGLAPAFSCAREFRIGGYEALGRWQKQRRNRKLTPDERRYLSQLAHVAAETARLAQQIERAYRKAFPAQILEPSLP